MHHGRCDLFADHLGRLVRYLPSSRPTKITYLCLLAMISKSCYYLRALLAVLFCTHLSDAFALRKTGAILRPANACFVNTFRSERKCLSVKEKDGDMDDGIKDFSNSDGDDFFTRVRVRNIDAAGIRNNYEIFGKPEFLSSRQI